MQLWARWSSLHRKRRHGMDASKSLRGQPGNSHAAANPATGAVRNGAFDPRRESIRDQHGQAARRLHPTGWSRVGRCRNEPGRRPCCACARGHRAACGRGSSASRALPERRSSSAFARRPAAYFPRPAACVFPSICSRDAWAFAAPTAVSTFFSSSGGGSTAGMPRDAIQSSRVQPLLWYRWWSS